MIRSSITKLLAATALLTSAVLPLACSHDSPAPDKFSSFDRKGMLQNLGANVVIPSFSEFATKADSLVRQASAFGQLPTAATLLSTQQMWLRTANAYKRCEAFQFGPLLDSQFAAQLDYWPIRPSTIESLLTANSVIDSTLIRSQGATVKGLAALEYALYDGGSAATLTHFSTGADAPKRRAYLLALAQDLSSKAQQVRNAWQNAYLTIYEQHDDLAITSSINITVNGIITHIDYIKDTKVGYPAGKKDGNPHPNEVEAYASGSSLPQLLNNLTSLERLFTGTGPTGSTGPGFNTFLDHMGTTYNGQLLSAAIVAQIADCRAKVAALGTTTLADAIGQNPNGVNDLYTSMKKLLVLTKIDMVSSLGVTLTFSANDGD